jgi:thymidylate kinase
MGVDKQMIINLLDTVNLGTAPDLTILLDLPATIAKKRIAKREVKNRFDLVKETQMEKQRYQFLSLAEILPNWTVIDASLEKEVIHQQIAQIIKERR